MQKSCILCPKLKKWFPWYQVCLASSVIGYRLVSFSWIFIFKHEEEINDDDNDTVTIVMTMTNNSSLSSSLSSSYSLCHCNRHCHRHHHIHIHRHWRWIWWWRWRLQWHNEYDDYNYNGTVTMTLLMMIISTGLWFPQIIIGDSPASNHWWLPLIQTSLALWQTNQQWCTDDNLQHFQDGILDALSLEGQSVPL